MAAVLSAAREERTVADLEDPTAWSTDAATVALLGAAGRVLGDPEISRHVGAAIVRQYEWTADGERMRPADLAVGCRPRVPASCPSPRWWWPRAATSGWWWR